MEKQKSIALNAAAQIGLTEEQKARFEEQAADAEAKLKKERDAANKERDTEIAKRTGVEKKAAVDLIRLTDELDAAKKPVTKPIAEAITVPKPPGESRVNSTDGLTYVRIDPKPFTMGCSVGDKRCLPDESPPHQVTISKVYWIGQTEVTQVAWKKVMSTDRSRWKGDDLPVESVTWQEANQYCRAIGGRLPTEAEWEYAARGATYAPLDGIAWYQKNSGDRTHSVGQKAANAFGLYDMLGNVWEWTADWYGAYVSQAAADPKGPASGAYRVQRGGAFLGDGGPPRVSVRLGVVPAGRSGSIGLRCVAE